MELEEQRGFVGKPLGPFLMKFPVSIVVPLFSDRDVQIILQRPYAFAAIVQPRLGRGIFADDLLQISILHGSGMAA